METNMNPVNWFEIPVTDLPRAKKFYETVLGLELTLMEMGPSKMAWFPMKEGVTGATGALVLAEGYTPSAQGTMVYFTVYDLDSALAKVAGSGGKVAGEKMDIGEYGIIAKILDTEGNQVSLHTWKK